jgi:hypothetical protein
VRADLPNGGWAELKAPGDLKVKDKIAVQRVIAWEQTASDEDDTTDRPTVIPVNAGLSDDLRMAMLGRVVTSWSPDGTTPGEIPLTPEILGDLDIDTYEALAELITDHMTMIRSRRPNRGTRIASNGSSRASQSRATRKG